MKDVLILPDTGELSSNIFADIPQLYTSVSSKQRLLIMLNCVLIWILGINLSETNLFHVLILQFIIWRDIYPYIIKRPFHGTLTERL